MSLSKECDQVSSSTSGYPVVPRGPLYPAVLPADDSDLVRFHLEYFRRVTDRVQGLFAKHAVLERQLDLNTTELKRALAARLEAECNWRSSSLRVFPILSDVDITSVLGQELSALGDLSLLQPPATTQSAATTSTTTAVRSTTTNPALPSTAATTVRKPKLTILPLRLADGSGSTTAAKNRPTKPGKRSSARPVCRKPSKRAAPSAAADDDLPASTSA